MHRYAHSRGWEKLARHGFRRGFGPAERGHHRRGGGRLFVQGDLRWAALALIAEKPRHGYEIIKEIEERSGGAYAPSPGVIYPTLSLLEEMGYVALASAEGGKKAYRVTPEGETVLAAHRPEVDRLLSHMAESRARHARPAPEVRRAWENLRTALNLKVAAAALSPEQVATIAAALDEAAAKIERS
jgi:DNA-binding PadR family transcriptional regulator